MRKANISDVAELAGVSTATVSRWLTDAASVRADSRRRIEEAVGQLGYRPQFSARAIRTGKTGLIGVLMNRLDLEIFSGEYEGVLHEASRLGYGVLTMNSEGSADRERECLRHFSAMPVDGLIMRSVSGSDIYRQAQDILQKPLVALSATNAQNGIQSVLYSAERSAYIAARYLLHLGHKRVGYVAAFRNPGIDTPRSTGCGCGYRSVYHRRGPVYRLQKGAPRGAGRIRSGTGVYQHVSA